MKKVLIALVMIALVSVSFQVIGNHYRYEIREWAIDYEAEKSRLVAKFGLFGNESFAYLEGPKVDGQETIIMLHGFGASKENWLRFAGYFSDQYHVIALDLAGHGENKPDISGAYRIANQMEFVKAVSQSLGLQKFHLVGNSMGGGISSLYAATYPDQVLSAVLISPAGVHDVPSLMEEALAKKDGSNPLIAKSEEEFMQLLDFVMEQPPYIPGPILRVEAERAVSRLEINQLIFKQIRSDLEIGIETKLKQIQAPVLIIWGDQDRAIHVDNIEKYATLVPNATKLVLEGIGHVAMVEAPQVSADAMLAFLQKQ